MTNQNILELVTKNEIKMTLIFILSPLTGYVFSPLSIIAPLFIWLNFKDRFALVNYYGKELLNFTINMFPIFVAALTSAFINPLFGLTVLVPIIIVIAFNICCIISIRKSKRFHFPYTFKLIKGI